VPSSREEKQPSNHKDDYETRKARDKALRKASKNVARLEKAVSEAEVNLKLKNEEVANVNPSDRKKMTELSYEFEEIQKAHDDLLANWEKALIEKENLEKG
jgi:hypothetical protein